MELAKNALNTQVASEGTSMAANIPSSWGRPWEFLNYEKFARTNEEQHDLFHISMELNQKALSQFFLGDTFQNNGFSSATTVSAIEEQSYEQ